jgi:hypothetical protein
MSVDVPIQLLVSSFTEARFIAYTSSHTIGSHTFPAFLKLVTETMILYATDHGIELVLDLSG